MLAPIELLDESERRYVASSVAKTSKVEERLNDINLELSDVDGALRTKERTIVSPEENQSKRKAMIAAVSTEPPEFAYERAIGNNDSVYSNFVELLSHAKQKVGRIVVKNGARNIGFATGFLVSDNLLLTNWHVFKDKEAVADSEVQFYYELDTSGNPPAQTVCFKLDTDYFFHSCKDLDYCFVGVRKKDVNGETDLNSIGYLFLDPAIGKLGTEDEELLNIIHHPNGDFKQLSIRENLFKKITPSSIWYESDTAQGSSGSPVFNDQWQVVALHHMGVPSRNSDGEYIDKYGRVIPKVGDGIDLSRIHWIANEGIRTSVILNDIFSKYPASPIIQKLQAAPSYSNPLKDSASNIKYSQANPTETHFNAMESTNTIHVSIPASLLEKNENLRIEISTGGTKIFTNGVSEKGSPAALDEALLEIKKLEIEDGMDYSNCKGYQSGFLGVDVPMPMPTQTKYVAKLLNGGGTVLKYYHYSVVFHSVRMQPIISAINVNGDTRKRLDRSKRGTDVWLRDNRLDYDVQLNDKYYKRSGFDRGHMARREDANWGKTAEDARLAADITCMYTNACPQINTLNQSSRGGLWGDLETLVLEHGAIRQRGREAKISVFNGPIFKEDDNVLRGIQVPMDFFKVILWINDKEDLKATAFKLSQVDLVGDIDFEAIDIDQNSEFKEYQVSIESLEQATKLDFGKMKQYDTFDAGADVELLSADSLLAFIEKQRE